MLDLTLLGTNYLDGQPSAEGPDRLSGQDRATRTALGPEYAVATESEVARAAAIASTYVAPPADVRADFLDEIAAQLEALGDAWLERAHQETALPLARLTGERGRTCSQLRMFAALLREGSWVEARIDRANPDRKPLPKPDLRRMLVPIGPVAVFGASNFPFAFSVAGGDTASALAAGCAVVVKAHPSHPGASELAAKAIIEAARIVGVPTSVFALLNGGAEVGQALVLQAEIAAVGFTGSEAAGRALFNLAASRPRPIPVYAEMGSVNPIFALPGALAERGEAFANAYADSVLLGIGQFCTNPGVLVGIASDDFQRVTSIVADRLTTAGNGTMLNDGIQARFDAAIAERGGPWRVVSGEEFLANPVWHEEVFGPAAVGVACRDFDELVTVARSLTGQLTASVHFADGDPVEELLPELVKIAGRLVANGFPTGVEVCPSMQHGGPYPASTDSRTTSVGTAAISRFARPVAWQGFPEALLPAALRDGNPQGITRLEG